MTAALARARHAAGDRRVGAAVGVILHDEHRAGRDAKFIVERPEQLQHRRPLPDVLVLEPLDGEPRHHRGRRRRGAMSGAPINARETGVEACARSGRKVHLSVTVYDQVGGEQEDQATQGQERSEWK